MALEPTKIKEEIATLEEKRASIERKIQGLKQYLGILGSNTERKSSGKISVRGGVDIRPDVSVIFKSNRNEPVRLKDIVNLVAQKHPEIDRIVIEKKMIHVKRTILNQVDYGRYNLKNETANPSEGGG